MRTVIAINFTDLVRGDHAHSSESLAKPFCHRYQKFLRYGKQFSVRYAQSRRHTHFLPPSFISLHSRFVSTASWPLYQSESLRVINNIYDVSDNIQ